MNLAATAEDYTVGDVSTRCRGAADARRAMAAAPQGGPSRSRRTMSFRRMSCSITSRARAGNCGVSRRPCGQRDCRQHRGNGEGARAGPAPARAAGDRAPTAARIRDPRRDSRDVSRQRNATARTAADRRRVLRSAAASDARRPRPDADDGGHLHQRIHRDDPGAERTGSKRSTGRPATSSVRRSAR